MKILYICSAARSGSTFTDMFLGGHSEIESLGELNFLPKSLALKENCSCLKKISECNKWKPIISELISKGINVDVDPYDLNLWDAIAWDNIDKARQTKSYLMKATLRRQVIWMKYNYPKLPIKCKRIDSWVNNKMMLYQIILNNWGARILIDSSKNLQEAIALSNRWPEIVKILFVVRDGRGVIAQEEDLEEVDMKV